MNEATLNSYLKQFLTKKGIEWNKKVVSLYNKSGEADLDITLPNGKKCYVELKGFNSKRQLTTLQKIFLLSHSSNCYCFYINSKETLQTFEDFINEEKWKE